MAVKVEDAGFEIRDQMMWVYGSGFPKSHNIGKAVDKTLGNDREVVGEMKAGKTALGQNSGWNQHENRTEIEITKGNSDYEGWGTALKPAHEPICMARKPLSEKSIAENVLKWGTGGINIDGCRIEGELRTTPIHSDDVKDDTTLFGLHKTIQHERVETTQGRFPANIMFDDDTDEDWKRYFYCPKVSKKEREMGLTGEDKVLNRVNSGGLENDPKWAPIVRKNNHPTVKPIKLMEYLITLVTPKGGVVLEPFMGSGSTGIAAKNLGMSFIGIEREQEYFDIATQRIGL
jgi:site-specific DNA-methyltransferase (adenine-specific)